MKRFTLIVAMVLMMAMPMMAERVTPETARKVATTFLNNNGAKSTQLTDLSKAAGFENLYIFNGEEGFVVMAADDCVQPILGYSLTGKFVAEGMPENVHGWLQSYNDEIQNAVDSKMRATNETAKIWKELSEGDAKAGKTATVVNSLVQTEWNQNGYRYNGNYIILFNNLCPVVNTNTYNNGGHAFTGCVATAMAQIMKYWNYPSQGTGSHSYSWNEQTLSADFGATTYDWQHMTNTYSNSSTNEEINAVGILMYHCGVSVEMNYGSGSSSASTSDVMDALQNYFGYYSGMHYEYRDDHTNAEWIAMLKNELSDNRPLQYRGDDGSKGVGHSFVCDGYDANDMFHFNWGWAGSCDGFYLLTNMKPENPGTGGGHGNYTYNQQAIFGIEPISDLAAPTLSAYTSEGAAYLTWNNVEGASSYDLYKNGIRIAEGLTTTSYTDANISFGDDYSYYIRAISSETRSNPSNTVTINSYYRNLTPQQLSVNHSEGIANLSWNGYTGGATSDLHYATKISGYIYGVEENSTYWGQRFPAEKMSNFLGMNITKISCCFYYASTYYLYVYSGDIAEQNKIIEQSYTKANNGVVWKDFILSSPMSIDCSKDLWIVLYNNDENISNPALEGEYDGDPSEANYMSSSLNDLTNSHSSSSSWLIRVYLTDGTFTYHLYDNGVSVANDIAATNLTINPTNNTAHQYTVSTNYYGGESAASNMAGLTLGTATLASLELGTNDMMTITEGSSLTVDGTLTNTNPDNLILEDGAQLINSSTDVKATVKKDITAFTSGTKDGWNLIASPFTENITPKNENGLTLGDFDLYRFNQSAQPDNQGNALEWENWKKQQSDHYQFSLENGEGYLYSNSNNQSLVFQGTLTADAEPTELDYDGNANLKGFNLIGNPYPCNAYTTQPFYVLQYNANEDRTKFVLGSGAIPPCTAIMVQAQGTGETVTFSKTALRDKPNITVSVAKADMRGSAIIDKARIGFEPSYRLAKFDFSEGNSQLYIPQNGQEFAVAYANEETEMPLNFKAAQNDTYTLSIETEDLELNYLHLIDNLTGNDVDLLATPTYTFEAKTNDYTTRFRLLFAPICEDANDDNATFAFISDGDIIVNNAGEASLQIVDMMGRVVVEGDATNRISISEIAPGVYVLRLIDGEKVKMQKIVIE